MARTAREIHADQNIGGYLRTDGARRSISKTKSDEPYANHRSQKGIAVTYQDFSLFPNLTVAENIAISGVIEEGKTVNWKALKNGAGGA